MNVAKGDCRTPLGSSEASVKGALQRARATLEARLPAGREHAPPPGFPRERQLASGFAAAVETSDIDGLVALGGGSAIGLAKALSLQNLITPVGTEKIGKLEYKVNLNDSPSVIAAFNDLPIKTVNGATIYMRDVAYVHDGSPPQTNVVRVDGVNAVLLSVVKAGETSTLAVIKGVKSLLPQIEQTLPAGLRITAVGDQSQFVMDAVTGVRVTEEQEIEGLDITQHGEEAYNLEA